MKEIILSGKGITKSFGENTVLHGIDVDIYAGDFTVIMGSSGSGKSTLLYAMSGMDRFDSGQLIYRQQDITNVSEKVLTKLRSKDFGFVFQRTHLISNLTLYENIRMAGPIGALSEKETNQLRFYFKDVTGANITATPIGYYTDTEGLTEAVIEAYQSNLGDTWGVDVYFTITKTIK